MKYCSTERLRDQLVRIYAVLSLFLVCAHGEGHRTKHEQPSAAPSPIPAHVPITFRNEIDVGIGGDSSVGDTNFWSSEEVLVFLKEVVNAVTEIEANKTQPKSISSLSLVSQEIVSMVDPEAGSLRGRPLKGSSLVNFVVIDGECDCYPSENGPLDEDGIGGYLEQALAKSRIMEQETSVRAQFNSLMFKNLEARATSGEFSEVHFVTVASCSSPDDCPDPHKPVCDNFFFGGTFTCVEKQKIDETCHRDDSCETEDCFFLYVGLWGYCQCNSITNDGCPTQEGKYCIDGLFGTQNFCSVVNLGPGANCTQDKQCISKKCAWEPTSLTKKCLKENGDSCLTGGECVSRNCGGPLWDRRCQS